jgi:hypothetical protein
VFLLEKSGKEILIKVKKQAPERLEPLITGLSLLALLPNSGKKPQAFES